MMFGATSSDLCEANVMGFLSAQAGRALVNLHTPPREWVNALGPC